MSRVKGVSGRAILVSVFDVLPGDILYIFGNEGDPIISKIEVDEDRIRFNYKPDAKSSVKRSKWMSPSDPYTQTFIHDLRGERFEYDV